MKSPHIIKQSFPVSINVTVVLRSANLIKLGFLNNFKAQQAGNIIDLVLLVTVKSNPGPAPGIPVIHQFADASNDLCSKLGPAGPFYIYIFHRFALMQDHLLFVVIKLTKRCISPEKSYPMFGQLGLLGSG